ncbi:MAG TPA: copper transporter [Clostridia bacterium]|nr:copper transporter [Clostridia bacterium]
MIIDLKYHIATLVAVFLALGLGIFIGNTLLGSDAVLEQQQQIADSLERQLEEIRTENKIIEDRANRLELEYGAQKSFAKEVFPLLVNERIMGKNLAIIETNPYGFPEGLAETLKVAGAKVTSSTTVLNGLELGENKEQILSELGIKDIKSSEIEKYIAGQIAQGIHMGDNMAVLNYLAQNNLIEIQGDYGIALDGVIIIGGCNVEEENKSKIIDVPVIDYFKNNMITVYGVEESNLSYSYMGAYQNKRISTVDNIDTIPGQLALVLLIEGKTGHYGIKPTAQQLIPAIN